MAYATCALLLLSFTATKTVAQTSVVSIDYSVLRDPINGSTNPYLIPGAEVRYKITIVGPDEMTDSSSGYLLTLLSDNLSDDLEIADKITTGNMDLEAPCVSDEDLIRLQVFSDDADRAGVFCLTRDTDGVNVLNSNLNEFGESIELTLNNIPGVLPATGSTAADPDSLKGVLLPGEEVLVEFNAVLR